METKYTNKNNRTPGARNKTIHFFFAFLFFPLIFNQSLPIEAFQNPGFEISPTIILRTCFKTLPSGQVLKQALLTDSLRP
jgi:hypothetical protein